MKKEYIYGIGGIFIGGLLMFVVMSNNPSVLHIRQASVTAPMNSSTIDQHFIEQMIPHHNDAITMAKLAQTRATHPELKELADSIIVSQGKEITQMKSWYKEWYGVEVPEDSDYGMMGSSKFNSMHMGMMGDYSDTTRLENADNFDREFLQEMIPHHQMAVMMATMLKSGTTRPEMKQLADNIITAQTKEISQMRIWLNEWE